MAAREHRLTGDAVFREIIRRTRPFHTSYFIVRGLVKSDGSLRYAFIISAKVSKKATVRNKLRRRLREIIRPLESNMRPHTDIMMIAKTPALTLDFVGLRTEIIASLKKADLLHD